MKHHRLQNRKAWNEAHEYHLKARGGDIIAYLKEFGVSDLSVELSDLGDVSGLRVLHQLCNNGLDSCALQQKGAKVTAIDISEAFIDEARMIGRTVGCDVQFYCRDVYDLTAEEFGKFDLIFLTRGAI